MIEIGSRDGLSVSLLPNRGLDIGALTFRDEPIGWHSPHEDFETAKNEEGTAHEWLEVFGGFMLTCGLHNVGQPSDGHTLHGRYSLLTATHVTVKESASGVSVQGRVTDGALICERTVWVPSFGARVVVDDVVRNESDGTVQAPMLYHVNFGEPFLGPRTSVNGRLVSDAEGVLELEFADQSVTTASHTLGIAAVVSSSGLHRAHQWVDTRRQVMSIEPANCSVLGRDYDRSHGDAPYLQPRQARHSSVSIDMRSL